MSAYSEERRRAAVVGRYGTADPYERHASLSDRSGGPEACWPWMGRMDHGYGRIGIGRQGVKEYAHRIAWVSVNGPIPDDMTVDHLCRNTRCVNPAHLEVVSRAENSARQGEARREHTCPLGHPKQMYGGRYCCRTCNLARQSRYRRVAA